MRKRGIKKFKRGICGNEVESMIDKQAYSGTFTEQDLKDFFKLLEKKANEINER